MRYLTEYFRPSTPQEAVELKRQFGAAAAYLAGGSDLMVSRSESLQAVIDIRHAGLDTLQRNGNGWTIGGAALLCDVEDELKEVAGGMLREAVRETAPWLIRNAATLAGNLANASPAADSVPALLALDAELTLLGNGEETVPAASVLAGPHVTTLGDRLIVAVHISSTAAARYAAFAKHSRSKSDIAQVNMAVALRIDNGIARDVRIALGAVAPTAIRARNAEALLEGRELAAAPLQEIQAAVAQEISPISDWRASADYRRRAGSVQVRRGLERIMKQAGLGETS
ncbi:MAG: FAD binding domain-containing protein [Chloroflexota bacterium]